MCASGLEHGSALLAALVPCWRPFPAESLEAVASFLREICPSLVITGTSGEGTAEKHLWRAAESLNIPSLAILDSWVNYGIRFSSRGLSQLADYRAHPDHFFLPTFIAVMDQLAAQEMIAEGIPGERVLVTGQPHFDSLINKSVTASPQNKTLLFISEPLESSYGPDNQLGYTEKTIFREILASLRRLEGEVDLVIKLHPREAPDSYDDLIQETGLPQVRIEKSIRQDLYGLITEAKAVLGMSSNVLVEAAVMGARVGVVQIGLRGPNPSVLCRTGSVESWDTPEKLQAGLKSLLQAPNQHSRARKFPVEPAIPKIVRIVRQLCQNPKQSPHP